jgi:hypothetical protein
MKGGRQDHAAKELGLQRPEKQRRCARSALK